MKHLYRTISCLRPRLSFLLCTLIIVLTTSKSEDDILASYGLGASSYIVKPISLDRLMRVVNSIGEYWVQIVEMPDAESGTADEDEID